MKEILEQLFAIKKKGAQSKPKTIPYIFKNFNVSGYYANFGITNIINVFMHALVEALNGRRKLPKYILMVPDRDIAAEFKKSPNQSLMMGAAIHGIIKQIDNYLQRQLIDLKDKRIGAAPPNNEHFTKGFWVRMLKRPSDAGSEKVNKLRGKFNTILEERLTDGITDRHLIMSIEVLSQYFDASGGLNLDGQNNFWREIDKAIQKLDGNEITLKPRKPQPDKNNKELVPNKQRRLPTPPKPREKAGNDLIKDNKARSHERSRAKTRSRSRNRSGTSGPTLQQQEEIQIKIKIE